MRFGDDVMKSICLLCKERMEDLVGVKGRVIFIIWCLDCECFLFLVVCMVSW